MSEIEPSTIDAEFSDDLYVRFRNLLLAQSGLFYPDAKRGDLAHGLRMILATSGHADLEALYAEAVAGGPAWDTILTHLTIGETYFFRNGSQFDALRQHLLPEIMARRGGIHTLRIWSAGCATGEEPYSLAITVADMLAGRDPWHISILATDINPAFLARAREALYGEWSFRETSAEQRARFWTQEGNRWRLNPEIRRMVNFARLNLAVPCFPSTTNGTCALDIIVCRNVTIYFDEATTRQIAERFYAALAPGGWLIVGHAEPQASVYHQFEVHNFPSTVIYRKPLDAPLFPSDRRPPTATLRPQTTTSEGERGRGGDLQSPISRREGERGRGGEGERSRTQPALNSQFSILNSQFSVEGERGRGGERGERAISNLQSPISNLQFSSPDPWPPIAARLAQGDKAGAEQLVRDLLRSTPDHVAALVTVGRLGADRGDWPTASEHCTHAIAIDPLCIEAHYILAQVHEHQGQLDEALAAYRRTTYLDQTFVPGMIGMGNIWRQLGRPASAQRCYRNALKQLALLASSAPLAFTGGITAAELAAFVTRQLQTLMNFDDQHRQL
jgi:chemotaxis methyl-accepting protein methylase/tetratricopeptide (TPR) repeat protein